MWTALEGVTAGSRYELRAHLATGGMAAVFRGWDHRLQRSVAVKVLRLLNLAEPPDVERFRREARAAAALRSPNIVEVYDFFEDEGCYYLVMELVEGINLKQHIAAHGPLDFREAFAIAAQVCAGLDAAHTAGYIHRDIKPQNILLGDDGSVKVVDFGIVHAPWMPSFTTGGIVLGTADYVSPEQAQGLPLAPTTDLYSLGVVLYEALTGVLPFTGTTPVAVALRHASEPPEPPRALNPRIPAEAERVVLRALRKDPATRYQSARAMAAALRRVLNTYPPASRAVATHSTSSMRALTAGGVVEEADEWRRLAAALLQPTQQDLMDDEETSGKDDSALVEANGAAEPAETFAAPFMARLAATRRIMAVMAMAALLLAGILVLHLIV